MNKHPLPSEILLLSPRPETDLSYRALDMLLQPLVAPVPVRVVHGDGSGDPAPKPGAALVTGGQAEALRVIESISGEGWRWVHLNASGPDHMHPWPAVPGDPLITYSRGVNARSVAEWALAAILFFYRDLDHYVQAGQEGRWDRQWARELSDQTLLVLGAGAAGSELAQMASALGMRALGVSLEGDPLPGFEKVFPPEETDRLLVHGDIVVVLLPLTPATKGFLSPRRIAEFREKTILLVASRGGIVDEEAVLEAVRAGRLRGAAFDVFAEEPLSPDSPLWTEPRILVTPHIAGTTQHFMDHTARILGRIWQAAFQEGDLGSISHYVYTADQSGKS